MPPYLHITSEPVPGQPGRDKKKIARCEPPLSQSTLGLPVQFLEHGTTYIFV